MGRVFQNRSGPDQRRATAPVFHPSQVRQEGRPPDQHPGPLRHQTVLGENPAAGLAGGTGTGSRSAAIQIARHPLRPGSSRHPFVRRRPA